MKRHPKSPKNTIETGLEDSTKQEYKTLRDFVKLLSFYNSFDVSEAGVNEVAKAVGMAPSKVSRMLRGLTEESFFLRKMN